MAGGAEAAKNFLESAFNKSKEVLNSAAESTKGFANTAIENVTKIIPGQQPAGTVTDPTAVGAGVVPPPHTADPTGAPI